MAADSVLLLWTTNTHMPVALRVMGAWGFDYRTIGLVWSKRAGNGNPAMGMGHYTRQSVELCLLGVRGRGLERKSASVRQLVETVPGEHSEKPAEVRDRIVELFGDVPRIELFATSACPGWTFWGPRNHRRAA
jgi:site-specific DNA-methyltransferase (adenine-specific)